MSLRTWAAAVLLIALGACTGADRASGPGPAAQVTSSEAGPASSERQYDEARARQLVAEAQEALGRGETAAAEIAFEQALDVWPTSKPAWDGLVEVYGREQRQEDLEVANFFAARMDWVAELPPLVASGAFENVAEGRVEVAQDNPELRRRSAELVDFLRTREAQARDATYDEEQNYFELVPAAAVTTVAAFLTGGAFFVDALFGN